MLGCGNARGCKSSDERFAHLPGTDKPDAMWQQLWLCFVIALVFVVGALHIVDALKDRELVNRLSNTTMRTSRREYAANPLECVVKCCVAEVVKVAGDKGHPARASWYELCLQHCGLRRLTSNRCVYSDLAKFRDMIR